MYFIDIKASAEICAKICVNQRPKYNLCALCALSGEFFLYFIKTIFVVRDFVLPETVFVQKT